MKVTSTIEPLCYSVGNLCRKQFHEICKKNGLDMRPEQCFILAKAVEAGGTCYQSEFSQFASIIGDKSSVSRLIQNLVVLGYIKRIEDPDDRRHTFLKVTDEGVRIHRQIAFNTSRRNQFWEGIFSEDELKLLITLLKKAEREILK